MTRRNLLKSLLNSVLSAPFLPLVWREKAEVPVAAPRVATVEFDPPVDLGKSLTNFHVHYQNESGPRVFHFYTPKKVAPDEKIEWGFRDDVWYVNGTPLDDKIGWWELPPKPLDLRSPEPMRIPDYDWGL